MSPEGKPLTLYTVTLDKPQMAKLQSALASRHWDEKIVAYAAFAYAGPKVQVVAYESGKVVIQGKGTQEFVEMTLEAEVTGVVKLGYDALHHPDWFELHAGCDEAGKGDLFGPLTTACVVAGGAQVERFIAEGVKDSKRLSDAQVLRLEKIIRCTPGVAVGVTQCGMARYNELMSKPRANLNNFLSWLHSKSLGDALDQRDAPWGLLDQFATRDQVDQYLARPKFELRRRTKAESDPVVAAASIVARAGYLKGLKALSDEVGTQLPKGSSIATQHFFKDLRDKVGADQIVNYAKTHFKLKALGQRPEQQGAAE